MNSQKSPSNSKSNSGIKSNLKAECKIIKNASVEKSAAKSEGNLIYETIKNERTSYFPCDGKHFFNLVKMK